MLKPPTSHCFGTGWNSLHHVVPVQPRKHLLEGDLHRRGARGHWVSPSTLPDLLGMKAWRKSSEECTAMRRS